MAWPAETALTDHHCLKPQKCSHLLYPSSSQQWQSYSSVAQCALGWNLAHCHHSRPSVELLESAISLGRRHSAFSTRSDLTPKL